MTLYEKITLTVAIVGFVLAGIGYLYLNNDDESMIGKIFAFIGITTINVLLILTWINLIWGWW